MSGRGEGYDILCPGAHCTASCGLCQSKPYPQMGKTGHNHSVVALHGSGYCIDCGARLETGHRYCWNCGAARWKAPSETIAAAAEPPGAGTAALAEPALRGPLAASRLGAVPWLYAVGACAFLLWTTRALAILLAPNGRSEMARELQAQGLNSASAMAWVVPQGVAAIAAGLVAAGLHAAAFYGLRSRRRWGWIAAVVVAAIWSLGLVGIPVLVRLLSRNVRSSFGVD